MDNPVLISIVGFVVLLVLVVLLVTSRYKVAGPNQAFIVTGRKGKHARKSAKVARHHGRCRHAGRRVTPPATYVVARGDTLWDIAKVHYRKGARYPLIYRANRAKISDPDLIYPCQRLFLPARHR